MPATSTGITILITGTDLKPVMAPVRWTQFDATLKFNDTGSGSFTAAAYPELLAAIQPGRRVTVIWRQQVLISGPIEKPGAFSWQAADQQTGGPGRVTVSFADNLAYLAWRLVYPNPAQAASAQTSTNYAPGATNAEVLLRALVNLNAGPGALTSRQIPHLALGALASVGTSVTLTNRFGLLTDVLRQVAISGGNLGFRIREDSGQLLFEVYAPTDRSGQTIGAVRFARGLGNLRSMETDPSAPVATVAIVGGTGTGAGRTCIERSTAAESTWGRMETFVDQSGVADGTSLQQYGDQALVTAAEKVGLTSATVDLPNLRYSTAYQLGDIVAVELPSGLSIAQPIDSVQVSANPTTGTVFVPAVGQSNPFTASALVVDVRDLKARVGRLERT